MDLHRGEVYRISCRQPFPAQHDLPGPFDCRSVYWKYLIDDSQQSIKCGLNGIRPRNGNIAVKDFLEHFGVSYQAFLVTD